MPELPEAEVTRRTLAPLVAGRRIESVAVVMPNRLSRPVKDPDGFGAALVGRVIAGIERRGKDLIFRLSGDTALVLNMGLWASVTMWDHSPEKGEARKLGLVVGLGEPDSGGDDGADQGGTAPAPGGDAATGPASEAPGGTPFPGASRDAVPRFLVVADVTFARWGVYEYEPAPPPPPYDAAVPLTGELLAGLAAAEGRGAAIKTFLTDGRALAGIGNGYADEILWRARIHPLRSPSTLDGDEWTALATAVGEELNAAIAEGGERGFLDALGRPGRRDRPIHHHAGEPCPRCGTPLQGFTKGGRETNFCPVCQPV